MIPLKIQKYQKMKKKTKEKKRLETKGERTCRRKVESIIGRAYVTSKKEEEDTQTTFRHPIKLNRL